MAKVTPIVFTHVPKTAGGSIHHSVQVQFGLDAVYIVTGRPALEELKKSVVDGKSFVYVGGHLTAADAESIYDDMILVAALRNPAERILSHFFYMLRYDHIRPADTTPVGILSEFESFYAKLSDGNGTNALCRYLSGAPDAAAAIEAVREKYGIVWSAERTEDAWPKIYRLCARAAGVDPKPGPVPMAPIHIADVSSDAQKIASGARPASYQEFLPEGLSQRVAAENSEDIKLIEWLGSKHDGLYLGPNVAA